MKKSKLIPHIIVILVLLAGAGLAKAFSPDNWTPGPGWTLAWSDEFNGPAIDTNKWTWDLGGGGWGNNELEVYTQTNSYISTNGELIIAATKDGSTYHSARLRTQGLYSQRFGKIAARIRLPYGKGIWPGWWMLGTNITQVSWPQCGEVDIMEMVGGGLGFDDTVYSTLHYGANNTSVGSGGYAPLPYGQFFYQDYHVFETEWNSNHIIFRVDSVEYCIIPIDSVNNPNRSAFQNPFFFILNVAVGGTWPGDPNGSTVFPQFMYVSWVRAYQPTTGIPVAPGGLTASAASSSQINLSWAASPGATSYNVKGATTCGGPYTTIASGVSSTSYSNTGLPAGTTYFYVVSATNSTGEGPNSQEANATTTGWAGSLVSQGQPVTASSFQTGNGPGNGNDGSLSTRWGAATNSFPQWWRVDLGSNYNLTLVTIDWYNSATRSFWYKIDVSPDDVNYTTVVSRLGNTTFGNTTDSLSTAARYVRVTVTGASGGGWASFYECQVYGSISGLAAPTGLTANTVSSSQINLSWNASSNAASYNVKRATVSGGPYTTIATGDTSTSYSDTGLSPSTTYYYVVSAVNGSESPNSSQASATTLPVPPPAPTGLTATAGNAQVGLGWTADSGATGYNVKRSTTNGGPYTIIGTSAATNYTDSAVVNGTTYYYVVSGTNSAGEGANSTQVSATPTAGGGTVLLSQGQPVTASSFQAGNAPTNGNDGNFSTRWAASSGTFPQWWRVDLGSIHTLQSVSNYWYNASSRSYKYQIQVSNDDTNYTTVVNKTNNVTMGNTSDAFSATNRYVRIYVTGDSAGFASFYESQVFGQ